jgi:hypothetical protein
VTEQYHAGVPPEKRTEGWLYDWHSGLLMGIASDELRARQPAGVRFKMVIGGCPHDVIIHKA